MASLARLRQKLASTNIPHPPLPRSSLQNPPQRLSPAPDLGWRDSRKPEEQPIHIFAFDLKMELFTDRECAALAWTEAVTLVSSTHVPDEVFEFAKKQFSDAELAKLTFAIVAINGWNRLAVSFRQPLPALE